MTEKSSDSEQSLITHLIELRSRILRAVICIFVLLFLLLPFANDIYSFAASPLIEKLPAGSNMIATEVTSPFLTPLKLTIFCAVLFAMPYIFFQAWSFIMPGLYTSEKKLILPLLISSTLLFYIGILFAYYIVSPVVFSFLTQKVDDAIQVMPDITNYLSFIVKLFFACGISFEVPIATFLLIRSGLVKIDKLTANRPYIILLAFFAGMLLTPPDVISQILLAIPIWLLFESGLLLGKVYNSKSEDSPD